MPGIAPFPISAAAIRARNRAAAAARARAKARASATANQSIKADPSSAMGRLLHGRGAQQVKSGGVNIGSLDVAGMQRFLKSKGYDISVDGQLGPVTRAALADFLNPKAVGGKLAQALSGTHITGKRDPKAFNIRFGNHPAKAFKPRGQLLNSKGNDPVSGGAGGGGGSANMGGSTAMLKTGVGTPIPLGLANAGAKLLNPDYANVLAGQEFDPSIHQAQLDQQHQKVDSAQALHDIQHWYGDVLASQGVASGRDSAISKAAQDSTAQSNAAVLASLGGGANDAAGVVGAQGQNNLGTLQALGSIQDQYNSDMAPLLKGEAAGASTREAARQSQLAAQLASQITDLMHQKGASAASHAFDIAQANNQTLDNRAKTRLDIMGANNQLAQQGFQNQLAEEQAQEAALMSGLKVAQAASKAPRGTFASLSGAQKTNLMSQLIGAAIDPNTGAARPNARGIMTNALRASGYSLQNPQVRSFLYYTLQNIG